ncbi:MAG: undecaprenyldiphospho-muramoylpentapeptide beta-N-acetylglucosaminyltransferase [Flavobacteriaceae bacterium]|nr:undecaprenyldiphospho-muramoylpentapeptide beta-N-acetylglucosaminyltransferase [Flavobacteriaceae bacterium]
MAKKIIVSGGGTGGHLFPAIAIAQELKSRNPQDNILFVGAIGKMEMHLVPKAGFIIKGLWIDGLHRKMTLRNLLLPFKVLISLLQSFLIIKKFKPDVVIGTGGYASFPILKLAQWLQVPTVIQEQNALVGMANRLLWKKATKIFVAFEFSHSVPTKSLPMNLGIPLRYRIHKKQTDQKSAIIELGLDLNKKTLLVLGGSLGARAINEMIKEELGAMEQQRVQIIWQCGKLYARQYTKFNGKFIKVVPFIEEISLVYSAADIIICRAGASTIAELACVGKPTIFIPSPNVANNHQYHNALNLQKEDAAILLQEKELSKKFKTVWSDLLANPERQKNLGMNFKSFARPQATKDIVNHLLNEVL